MTTAQRKPMTFDMGEPASAAAAPPPASRKRMAAATPAKEAVARQHIGARVPQQKYRQLKAHAVLSGTTVQALVEQIIDQYLETVKA